MKLTTGNQSKNNQFNTREAPKSESDAEAELPPGNSQVSGKKQKKHYQAALNHSHTALHNNYRLA